MDTNPSSRYFSITPGTSVLAEVVRGIYVGGDGDVEVTNRAGETVVFVGAVAGSILPVVCTHVLATNTTATNLIGLV